MKRYALLGRVRVRGRGRVRARVKVRGRVRVRFRIEVRVRFRVRARARFRVRVRVRVDPSPNPNIKRPAHPFSSPSGWAAAYSSCARQSRSRTQPSSAEGGYSAGKLGPPRAWRAAWRTTYCRSTSLGFRFRVGVRDRVGFGVSVRVRVRVRVRVGVRVRVVHRRDVRLLGLLGSRGDPQPG